jgi:ribosomal protein S18 acetylase RimI-like enzyme
MDSSIAYRELHLEELDAAAEIVGQAMLDNPLHVRIFGGDHKRGAPRLTYFYRQVLPRIHSKGRVLGAFKDARMVGVVGMSAPGRCQPSMHDMLRTLPRLALHIPPTVLFRIRRWIAEWDRFDLEEPHWHLGPAAVLPSLQRQGIGSDYLIALCDWLDAEQILAYLETERERNVGLYERFGFETVRRVSVLDVPCWFMRRNPHRS